MMCACVLLSRLVGTKGDVIALMGGDRAPCLAEVLRLEAGDDGSSIPAGKTSFVFIGDFFACFCFHHRTLDCSFFVLVNLHF